MAVPVLTNPVVQLTVPSSGIDLSTSYLLDTLMGGSPGSFTNDCDLTCPVGGTPTNSPTAVAGPYADPGLYAERLYIEVAGTIVVVMPTGIQDTMKVLAGEFNLNVAYVVAAGTTCTGIHAWR